MNRALLNHHLLIGALSAFYLSLGAAASSAAPPIFTVQKDVVYAATDDGNLTMDVASPVGKSNGLGIVDVAQGGGHTNINEIGQARIADEFCGRGYTLFVVRPGPLAKFNVIDMADHVRQAIAFIKDKSDQFKVDPDLLGMLSTAAGVHLVALVAATADDQSVVKAAGVYYPPTDFKDPAGQKLYVQANTAAWERITDHALQTRGIPVDSTSAESGAGLRDPRVQLPMISKMAPPLLIVHGDADPLVPNGKSNLLFIAMRDANKSTDMIVRRPGRDPQPTIRAEVKTLADWFDKQLATN